MPTPARQGTGTGRGGGARAEAVGRRGERGASAAARRCRTVARQAALPQRDAARVCLGRGPWVGGGSAVRHTSPPVRAEAASGTSSAVQPNRAQRARPSAR